MSDNVFDEFRAELEEAGITQEDVNSADHDIMGKLGDLVDTKFQLESQIAEKEAELKELQDKLKEYDQIKIPELIEAAGLAEITTKDGYKVTVKQEYRGNISEANSAYVLDWFIKSGGADTVKSKFEVPVSINDKETMSLLEDIFNRTGVGYSKKINIAWNTLAGVIKELDTTNNLDNNKYFEELKKEHNLPDDMTLSKLLGVYKYKNTKVAKPKAKKK